jgi:hypothetical protein
VEGLFPQDKRRDSIKFILEDRAEANRHSLKDPNRSQENVSIGGGDQDPLAKGLCSDEVLVELPEEPGHDKVPAAGDAGAREPDQLDKIPANDMLIIFAYLNMAIINFEVEQKGKNLEKINPNILKIFMRHYPQFAKERSYELFSDEEDYDEVEGRVPEKKESVVFKKKPN